MPANPKYLSNPWSRAGKISAAILGGYIVTMTIHMAFGILLEDKQPLVLTTIWSSWIMWIFFMILAFTFDKAWKAWALYTAITLLAGIVIYLNM